ncbi:MAG: hypothetical protein AAF986_04815 [Pseudomonadota bacterium]
MLQIAKILGDIMPKQLNIRSDEAIEIVEAIHASTKQSRKDIVVQSLTQFHDAMLKKRQEQEPDWADIFAYAKSFAAIRTDNGGEDKDIKKGKRS